MKKPSFAVIGLLGALALFGLVQLVPVQRTNPPVTNEVQWDSPQTKALWDRACRDCHSNETVWTPVSYIAPASWLVSHDVTDGRRQLNVSEASRGGLSRKAQEAAQEIRRGSMPSPIYLPLHPEASLSAAEKDRLIAGIQASFR